MATSAAEKYSVKRWNKEKKAYDKVQLPMCILTYNQNMGGVDWHDRQVSRYWIKEVVVVKLFLVPSQCSGE